MAPLHLKELIHFENSRAEPLPIAGKDEVATSTTKSLFGHKPVQEMILWQTVLQIDTHAFRPEHSAQSRSMAS